MAARRLGDADDDDPRVFAIHAYADPWGHADGVLLRLRRAAALGSGFLYAISRLGVTGARDRLADGAQEMVARIRAASDLPVALGFGISKPEHVREVGRWADAAVVGSALVDVIARESASDDLNSRVEEYVRWLKS